MSLGHSCQNCRLSQASCDLPSTAKALDQHAPTTPSKELRIDTKNLDRSPKSDTAKSSSVAGTPKPTIVSRSNHSAAVTTPFCAQGDHDIKFSDPQNTLVISEDQRKSIWASADLSILDVAAKIGLQLPGPIPSVIYAMFRQWQNRGEVKPVAKRPFNLQHYYSNLVTLYILAYAKIDMDLCFAVLLRFQTCSFESNSNSELPDVQTAICAFQYLPWDDPLCRWIAILYGFLWGTEIAGDYAKFMKDNPGIDRLALLKLLYGVAYTRDPHTMGHDNAVLARWCDVHDHANDTAWERGLCTGMQSSIKSSVEDAKERENARMVEEARHVLGRLADSRANHGANRISTPASPFTKGKRKADHRDHAYSSKKFKRSDSYGSR